MRKKFLFLFLLFLVGEQVYPQLSVGGYPHSRQIAQPAFTAKYGEDSPPVMPYACLNWGGVWTPEIGASWSIIAGKFNSEMGQKPVSYSVIHLQAGAMFALAQPFTVGPRLRVFYAPQFANFITVGGSATYLFHKDYNLPAIYPELGILIRPWPYKHYVEPWRKPCLHFSGGYNVMPGELPPGYSRLMVSAQLTFIGNVNRVFLKKLK